MNCNGKGRFWDEAIEGTAGVVGRDVARKVAGFGYQDSSDIMLAIPSDSVLYEMGMFDRVAAVNRTEPFSINYVSGINDVIKFSIVSIDRVVWNDPAGAIVDGDIPDINADGSFLWGATSPPSKVTFSVTGRRNPEYYCYDELPLDRAHFHGKRFPRRVVVRRFDQYGN